MSSIEINLEMRRAILSHSNIIRKCDGQWWEFYALLTLKKIDQPKEYVRVDEVRLLQSWKNKKPQSIGKMVSREIDKLEKAGLSNFIECLEKTKFWRLGLPIRNIKLIPSKIAIHNWLEKNTTSLDYNISSDDETIITWCRGYIEAYLCLHSGETEKALELSTTLEDITLDDTLALISKHLKLLAAIRNGSNLTDIENKSNANTNVELDEVNILNNSLYARILSRYAHAERVSSPEKYFTKLKQLVNILKKTGDFSGLGDLYNTLAVLARRSGQPKQAIDYLVKALPLLILSGDFYMLQNALLNLGHARYAYLGKPDKLAFFLIDLSRKITHELGLGGDSAQAPLIAASLSLKVGKLDKARLYLEEAEGILNKVSSEYDNACYWRIKAQYIWLKNETNGQLNAELSAEVEKYLNNAIKNFSKSGDTKAADKTARELHRMKSGKQPFIYKNK